MKTMRFHLSHGIAAAVLLLGAALPPLQTAAAEGAAQTVKFANHRFDVPPSAQLNYAIRARQSGFALEGSAVVNWNAAGRTFAVATEVRSALLGKILDSRSEGGIDKHGLAPLSFNEKRFRRDPTTTTFDRAAGAIRFSASDLTYPIRGGEQDRNSAIWQLISVARASPSRFKPGSEWTFFVAGQRDAEPWTFRVLNQEKIRTPMGELGALHILKAPPPDSQEQRVDIWLGPQQEWYPVRLRYSENNGDFIEQNLESISRKAS